MTVIADLTNVILLLFLWTAGFVWWARKANDNTVALTVRATVVIWSAVVSSAIVASMPAKYLGDQIVLLFFYGYLRWRDEGLFIAKVSRTSLLLSNGDRAGTAVAQTWDLVVGVLWIAFVIALLRLWRKCILCLMPRTYIEIRQTLFRRGKRLR